MLKNVEIEEDLKRHYYSYIKILICYINGLYCKQYLECYKKTICLLEENFSYIKSNESLCKDLSKRIKTIIFETNNKNIVHFLKDVLRHQFKEENFLIDFDFVNFSSNLNIEDRTLLDQIEMLKKKNTLANVQNIEKSDMETEENLNYEELRLPEKQKVKINFFDENLNEQEYKLFLNDNSTKYNYSNINLHLSMYDQNYNGKENYFQINEIREITDDFIGEITKKFNKHRIYLYEHYFFWFKEYFHHFLQTENTLINEDGYIPKTWRYYIALMAVSSTKCEYVFKLIEEKFLESGGDESWLIFGLDVVPEKLKKLARFNNVFTHQPWKIKGEDLKELTNKKDGNDTSCWNMNELIQASMIIVHYHKVSLIVQSLRINLIEEIEHLKVESDENKEFHEKDLKKKLLKNLENIDEEDSDRDDETDLNVSESHELKIEIDEKCLFEKHVSNFCNLYHDFDAHSEEYSSYLEFNWNDHGYYIMKNLYPKGVNCVNEEIEYITKLTTNSLGDIAGFEDNSKLNTFPIRYAVSCYIEKILGYIHEDYNYSNVNKLLEVNYKKFIKNVSCYPNKLTKNDFKIMNLAFNKEEIMHIILLVAIIKSRTQLTYLASSLYELIKNID